MVEHISLNLSDPFTQMLPVLPFQSCLWLHLRKRSFVNFHHINGLCRHITTASCMEMFTTKMAGKMAIGDQLPFPLRTLEVLLVF